MQLKPCPNCGSDNLHHYGLADEVECNDCSELRRLEDWESETARVRIFRERAEKAEADKSMLFDEALRQKKRAIKAEAERDVLVEALAWGAGKEKRSIFDKLSWMYSKKKWLEYAAQEAAKREGGGE